MKAAAIALTCICFTFTLSEASQCQWGPAYWCQSEAAANECGQLRYCRDNVWKTNAEKAKGAECDLCKLVAEFLDEFVDSNTTEAQAKAAAESFCSTLGPVADDCKEFVEEYFDDLWKLMEEELSPDEICTQLGLCSIKLSQKAKGAECDLCKLVAEFLDEIVDSNTTEAQAKAAVESFCSTLGPVADDCKEFVENYFDDLWKLIEQELSPEEICTQLGLCSIKLSQKAEGLECEACKILITELKKYADSNATEQEAEKYALEACTYLGGFAEDCKEMIEKYFHEIWEDLMNDMSPADICTELGLCTSLKQLAPKQDGCAFCKDITEFLQGYVDSNVTEEEVKEIVEEICLFLSQYSPEIANECKMIEDNFDTYWKLLQLEIDGGLICIQLGLCSSQRKFQIQADACEVCKDIDEYFQTYVDNNATEEKAKEALMEFCSFLSYVSPELGEECDGFENDYFDKYWELLKNELDRDAICFELCLCSSLSKKLRMTAPRDDCTDCELVVTVLKPFVDSNATEEMVKEYVEKLCNFLGEYLTLCQELLDGLFPVFWDLLKKEIDEDKICQELHFCPSKNSKKVEVVAMAAEALDLKDLKCDICKVLEKVAKPLVDRNATEGEVKDLLEGFCDLLSDSKKDECKNFLKMDFDLFWQILKQQVDDGELCELIGVCNGTAAAAPHKPMAVMAKKRVKEPELILCEICKFVLDEIAKHLVTNATEKEIEEVVEKICDFFPSAERKYCDEFIADYGDEIIKALVDGIAADAVCTVIGLCLGEEQPKTFTFNKNPDLDDCSVCEDVMEFVKELMGENFTEEEAVKALDVVCNLLPSPLQDECTDFVNEYGPEVVQLIAQGIDPDKICEELKLCPSSQSAMASPWRMIEKMLKKA